MIKRSSRKTRRYCEKTKSLLGEIDKVPVFEACFFQKHYMQEKITKTILRVFR